MIFVRFAVGVAFGAASGSLVGFCLGVVGHELVAMTSSTPPGGAPILTGWIGARLGFLLGIMGGVVLGIVLSLRARK